jgi:hypothetical protein
VLSFPTPDAMYVVQVLQCRKDLAELTKASKLVRSYYLRSLDDFDRCRDGIVDLIYNNEHDAVRHVYESACGNAPTLGEKLWLVDMDTLQPETLADARARLDALGAQVRLQLRTHGGHHLLTTPFSLDQLTKPPHVDVIKHGTTLMYKPGVSATQ